MGKRCYSLQSMGARKQGGILQLAKRQKEIDSQPMWGYLFYKSHMDSQ